MSAQRLSGSSLKKFQVEVRKLKKLPSARLLKSHWSAWFAIDAAQVPPSWWQDTLSLLEEV